MRFRLGVAVFVVCLLGGIGYTLAVLNWSGEPVATVAHPETEGTFTAPLDLDPAMNPLRAGLDTRYSQTLGSARLAATVTLRTPDGAELWTRRLRVTTTGEGGLGGSTSTSMPIERFDVAAAGRYELEIRLDDDLGARFVSASVDVRRNVRPLNGWLLGGLAVGGTLGLGLSLAASVLRDARDAVRSLRAP